MMKKTLFASFLLVLLSAFSVPSRESTGEVVRLTRYMGETLTGVSASFLFRVELIASSETKAVVELPLEMEEYLIFDRDSRGVIKVDLRQPREVSRRTNNSSYWENHSLVLKIYTPTIEYLSLSSLAKATASGKVTGTDVEVKMETAPKLERYSVSAQHRPVKLGGCA